MTYSEKVDLEHEKSARIAIHNEYEMLIGGINRIFMTDDMSELNHMYECAKKSIDKIYGYHLERVRELKKINGGTERCAQ